jgi:ferritin-like metal-binding protein YciE
MTNDSLDTQLEKYLSDAFSIEKQALVQMKMAPGMAGDPRLAKLFEDHLHETEGHERIVGERLEAHGGSPSTVKNVVMEAGGVGFALFAKSQPDTPGKLVAHAHSYEALEEASYELLAQVAERAGDQETVEAARRIRDEERAMKERLARCFETAAQASLRDVEPEDMDEQLLKYLADAHALEQQAISLLERGPAIAGDSALGRLFEEHLAETREHERLVEQLITEKGGRTSSLKDAAMSLGGLNWGGFFAAQPDTPGKLAAFAYAFEHLEIAGYELLKCVAAHAADGHAIQLAERILAQERAAAEKIAAQFPHAADASLEAQGVTV